MTISWGELVRRDLFSLHLRENFVLTRAGWKRMFYVAVPDMVGIEA